MIFYRTLIEPERTECKGKGGGRGRERARKRDVWKRGGLTLLSMSSLSFFWEMLFWILLLKEAFPAGRPQRSPPSSRQQQLWGNSGVRPGPSGLSSSVLNPFIITHPRVNTHTGAEKGTDTSFRLRLALCQLQGCANSSTSAQSSHTHTPKSRNFNSL